MLHGLLIEEVDPEDFRFLAAAIADGFERDLDAELEHPEERVSLLWSMLWEGARQRRFGRSCPKQVAFRFRGGRFVMELDLAESPECGYLRRNPAPHITRLLAGGGRTMIDIGANAGFHALCAASTFSTVHAFEPVPQTAARLAANIARSELASRVRLHEVALSDREGTVSMRVEAGHCGANRIDSAAGTEGVAVPMTTLDAEARRSGIEAVDLIKIDVEGHERSVIAGGRELLERDRPRIVVELGSIERYRGFRAELPKGYRAFVPRRDGRVLPLARLEEVGEFRDLLFQHATDTVAGHDPQ